MIEQKRSSGVPVNIIIGRFQPFTKGHEDCADFVFNETGLKSVLCVIDTKVADSKHPFLTNDLEEFFNTISKKSGNIIGWVRVSNADIVKNAEALRNAGYDARSWSCGTDRIDQYTKMTKRYGEQAGLAPDFEVFEIPRTDDDVSATKVRAALADDDVKTFEKMVPKYLHKYFDMLKQMIQHKVRL